MTETYRAVDGSQLSHEKAQVYGEHIQNLIDNTGVDQIKPEHLMADAAATNSPLHTEFEWDDQLAATSFRRTQALRILRSINVVIGYSDAGAEVTARAFPNVYVTIKKPKTKAPAEPTRVYVTIQRAASEPDLRAQIVEQALTQLRAWRRKYQIYSELNSYFRAIDMAENREI